MRSRTTFIAAVADQVRRGGGVPRTRNGSVIVPEDAAPSRAGLNLLRSVTRMKSLARSFASRSAAPSGPATVGSLQAGLAVAEHHLPGFLAAHGFGAPGGTMPQPAAVASTPVGVTADGREVHVLEDGTEVIVAGRNADGSPMFVLKDNTGQLVMGISEDGRPILAPVPAGQVVVGVDAGGRPVLAAAAPPPVAAAPTGQRNERGEDIFLLADGTEVVIAGRREDGSPIYARADDPTMVVTGIDASGAPVCVAVDIVGTNADGTPIYGEMPAAALAPVPSGVGSVRWGSGMEDPRAKLERQIAADGTEVFVVGCVGCHSLLCIAMSMRALGATPAAGCMEGWM